MFISYVMYPILPGFIVICVVICVYFSLKARTVKYLYLFPLRLLVECLVHSIYTINICWLNEWFSESTFLTRLGTLMIQRIIKFSLSLLLTLSQPHVILHFHVHGPRVETSGWNCMCSRNHRRHPSLSPAEL